MSTDRQPEPVTITVIPDAVAAIRRAATAAPSRETGGVLIGWWTDGHPVVRCAVEVPDPDATETTWTRSEATAQAALDAVRDERQDPSLGYVGDWHTHPAPHGPSAQDVATLLRTSQQYNLPVVLIIHRSDGTLDRLSAQRGRLHPVSTDQQIPPRIVSMPVGQRLPPCNQTVNECTVRGPVSDRNPTQGAQHDR